MELHFHIFPEVLERLNKLKIKTEADTYAEVISNALNLYYHIVMVAGQNAKLTYLDARGITVIKPLFKKV